MIGVQGESGQYKHYDVHSLYGLSMAIPTQKLYNNRKRGYVLSRSTFVSSGQYTGHWLGDNRSKWSHMKDSVIGMLEFNLFGIPYVGADICGFNDKTTPALCRRWQQLGAFYPFSRNHHNGWGGDVQDPAIWADIGHPEVTEAAKQSLRVRYQLLPYLYTLFFKAHVLGNTVVRPLFHEYPTDPQTYGIDEQFMWGSVVLFSPFLYENQTEVNAYLPDDVWYEPSVEFVKLVPKTGHVKLQDTWPFPPIHMRGGHIIPIAYTQAINTQQLRDKPISIEVYPKNKSAKGDMYWDDGDSLNTIETNHYNFYEFELLSNCSLHIVVNTKGYTSEKPHIIEKIAIANTLDSKLSASIDGKPIENIVSKDDSTIFHLKRCSKCLQMYYCGRNCQTIDWSFHKNECKAFRGKTIKELDSICLPLLRLYLRIKNDKTFATERHTLFDGSDVCLNDLKTKVNVNSISVEMMALFAIICKQFQVFGFSFDAKELLQWYGLMSKTLFSDPMSEALYLQVLPISHSCLPNMAFVRKDDSLEIRVIKSVAIGEELTMSWIGLHMNRNQRRQELNVSLTVCQCRKCRLHLDKDIDYEDFNQLLDEQKYYWMRTKFAILRHQYIEYQMDSNFMLYLDAIFGSNVLNGTYWSPMDQTIPAFVLSSICYSENIGYKVDTTSIKANDFGFEASLKLKDTAKHNIFEKSKDSERLKLLVTYYTENILRFKISDAFHTRDESSLQSDFPLLRKPLKKIDEKLRKYRFNLNNDNFNIERKNTSTKLFDTSIGGLKFDDQFSQISSYLPSNNVYGLGGKTHSSLRHDLNNKTWATYGQHPFYTVLENNGNSHGVLLLNNNPKEYTLMPAPAVSVKTIGGILDFFVFIGDNPEHVIQSYTSLIGRSRIEGNENYRKSSDGKNGNIFVDIINSFTSTVSRLIDPLNLFGHKVNPKSVSSSDLLNNLKNLYSNGIQFDSLAIDSDDSTLAIPARKALTEITGKRGYVLSRSTSVSSGQYTGHWLADTQSTWSEMKNSVIGMLEYNLFGIPYVGADICGFEGKASAELCLRWLELGAFYPLSRSNHKSSTGESQDPSIWADRGHPDVALAANISLEVRHQLLPYLYTLFFKAHVLGNTVARPVFHEYPTDPQTYGIDEQFMWGPVVMFSPILRENQTEVNTYLPDDVWYAPNAEFVSLFPHKGYVNQTNPFPFPPTNMRGGYIIPMGYTQPINSQETRDNPIAVEVYPKNKTAKGDMFWDDGDSLNNIETKQYNFYEFELFSNCSLHIVAKTKGYTSKKPHIVEKFAIANTVNSNITASVNGKPVAFVESRDDSTFIHANLDLNAGKEGQTWVVDWKTADNTCNLN
ncbi:unnamed protein product [Medioppia subpectinata]|uniref:MYND-type domain-containing protein n=1 Tax=Medioppia subpectinata TaxID=1979941 RepID=A0A7R9KEM4_9ACAR|nr:unnamed protein product [Medioppia subpectinata]CAG2101764.1 unnamed protein product [Medioppia subpectinata]